MFWDFVTLLLWTPFDSAPEAFEEEEGKLLAFSRGSTRLFIFDNSDSAVGPKSYQLSHTNLTNKESSDKLSQVAYLYVKYALNH